MEILKQGDVSRLKRKKRFICGKCGCEFVADKTEYKPASQIDSLSGINSYCNCPCCGDIVHTKS